MENSFEDPVPPPLPACNRKAAIWAWPVIVIATCYVAYIAANPPEDLVTENVAAVEMKSPSQNLLVLQLQGKMAIGISIADPLQAQGMLDQLEPMALSSDGDAVAVAALHRFIDYNSRGMQKADALFEKRKEQRGADETLLDEAKNDLANGVAGDARGLWKKRVGWFSTLFPEDSDGVVPSRPELQKNALFVTALMTLASLGILAGAAIGFALLIVGIVRKKNGKLVTRFEPTRAPAGIFLEAFAIYLGLMALSQLLGILLMNSPAGAFVGPVLFVAAFVIGLLWPKFCGVSWGVLRKSMGLHRGKGVMREIGAGLVGYLAMLPILGVGLAIMGLIMLIMGIDKNGLPVKNQEDKKPTAEETVEPVQMVEELPQAPKHPITDWIAEGNWKLSLFVFFLAAVVAPLFEEIMFRGALFPAIRSRWRFVASALLTGFIFAIIHPQGWMAAPALTAMGIGFAMIREWRDSLIAPMTAHAFNNGCIVCGLLLAL